MKSCNTQNPKVDAFIKFRKSYPQNVFLQVDKSKDLCYLPRHVYHSKLEDLFSDRSKFTPIEKICVEDEVTRFNTLLKNTLSTDTVKKLAPQHSIMDCYGTVKLHKPGSPLRPISTGFKSLTAGANDFLVKTFSQLLSDSIYKVSFPKNFKNKCDKENFDNDP